MHRTVDGVEGQVEEEWLFGVFVNEGGRLTSECVGRVGIVLRLHLEIAIHSGSCQRSRSRDREIRSCPAEEAVELLKAPIHRMKLLVVAEMPLTHHAGRVAG